MSPRDAREYETRKQQIIDGAFRVFAQKGYEKATNKEIAKEAGIGSPGLIYHYFKNKRDLFQRVIESKSAPLQLFLHSEEMMDRPPNEVLPPLATTFVEMLETPEVLAAFRLIFGEAARRPSVASLVSQVGPQRVLRFLRRYFEHQIELGAMKPVDTSAAARAFIGPLVLYIITKSIFVQEDAGMLTPQLMVDTAVDIFLQGIEPIDSDP